MSSTQPDGQVTPVHATELQWERLRPLMRFRYLIKDETPKTIAEVLTREPLAQGLNITKATVEKKLKQWDMYKNLSINDWRYVGHVVDERKQQKKDSVVILSGRRLDLGKVESKVGRHKPVLELTAPKVTAPDPAYPLDICTPRATDWNTTRVLEHYRPWPENLPWFEFTRNISFEIVSGTAALSQPDKTRKRRLESTPNEAGGLVRSQRKRLKHTTSAYSADSETAQVTFIHNFILKHIMNEAIASLELNASFVASRSIDRLAGTLDRVIPEFWKDENVARASLLVRGTYQELQRELLAILVYLVSNRLVLDLEIFSYYRKASSITLQRLNLLQFFRSAGLTDPSALKRFVSLSRSSVSLTVLVDVLFEAAVTENSVDVARILLAEDDRIHPDRKVYLSDLNSTTFLHASVIQGNLSMVEMLIAAGADIDLETRDGESPLTLAAYEVNPVKAAKMINLLLKKGANLHSNSFNTRSPLETALLSANAHTAKLLREKGATIHNYCLKDIEDLVPYRSYGSNPELLFSAPATGPLCLAALALNPFFTSSAGSIGLSTGVEVKIISTMKVFRNEKNGHVRDEERFNDWSNAMVVAACRGHTHVLSYLYASRAEMFGPPRSRHLCSALLASLQAGQAKACHMLLSWGAALDTAQPSNGPTTKQWTCRHGNVILPPIHMAVLTGSIELLWVCLKGSLVADLDVPAVHCDCPSLHPRLSGSFEQIPLRPLSVALVLGYERMALYLLELGALYTDYDMVYAARTGLEEVVVRLLAHGVSSAAVDGRGITALQTALQNHHERVAVKLLEAGAPIGAHLVKNLSVRKIQGIALAQYLFAAALSVDESLYRRDILCAVIALEARHPCAVNMGLFRELLRRSQLPDNVHQGFPTEAVREAVKHRRLDLLHEIMCAFGAETRGSTIVHKRAYSRKPCPDTVENGDPDLLQNDYVEVRGCRPIGFAINLPEGHDRERIILGLLDSGFPVDGLSLSSAFDLRLAEEVLDKLIDKCDIAAEDGQEGICLLRAAVFYGNIRLIKGLIDRGAHLSAFHDTRATALDAAVEKRDLDITLFLLQNGADPSDYGQSAMTIAATNGDIGIVKCLLDFGADLNVPRGLGTYSSALTPLEAAAKHGRLDVVCLLLACDLDTEHTGRVQFVRAIMIAEESGHRGVAQILREHRSWSPKDEELRKEFDQYPYDDHTTFLHPLEYEGTRLRSRIRQWVEYQGEMPCKHYWKDPWWKGGLSTQKILHEEMVAVFQEYSPEMYNGSCKLCKTSGWEKPTSIPYYE